MFVPKRLVGSESDEYLGVVALMKRLAAPHVLARWIAAHGLWLSFFTCFLPFSSSQMKAIDISPAMALELHMFVFSGTSFVHMVCGKEHEPSTIPMQLQSEYHLMDVWSSAGALCGQQR
jgi:hypothetical protein